MKVLVIPKVRQYLKGLSQILYDKGYFSYLDRAEIYVEELFGNIETTLPIRPHRPAPRRFDPEDKGMYMASFRRSRATTWYVFFTKYGDGGEIIYLVHRIENNRRQVESTGACSRCRGANRRTKQEQRPLADYALQGGGNEVKEEKPAKRG